MPTLHAVAGCEEALHSLRERDVWSANMRQNGSESRAPQYIP